MMVAGADDPNGRQYHQFDMDLMVCTAEVLDFLTVSDSCAVQNSVSDEFDRGDGKLDRIDRVTWDSLVADFCFISSNLFWNLATSLKMFGARAPTALPSETRTLPRGCLDMRNSRAARSDLSTILNTRRQKPIRISNTEISRWSRMKIYSGARV